MRKGKGMSKQGAYEASVTSATAKKTAKKSGWWKVVKSHARRLSLEFLNIFINHNRFYLLLGSVNKRVHLIKSVFLVYPATEEYALAYVYKSRIPKLRWTPWPCGLLLQNGKLTVMFCISASNGHFRAEKNIANLYRIVGRMEELRQMLGAESKTFAGILPGILRRKGVIEQAHEADLTANAVTQAIAEVRRKEQLSSTVPIVVLGAKGFIGEKVVACLRQADDLVYGLDKVDGHDQNDWPKHLRKQMVIIVNITLKDELANYIDAICPGSVVLNEVYPEPTEQTLERLALKTCFCYHIVGIDAIALPPFPRAYRGAIPCCAAWASSKMRVVIRRLN
ncbi:MAG: hypothetical protein ABIH67_02830 [Candidatus Uhrbacteria bacterium]